MRVRVPSIILGAGAAGVGKSTVLRDIVRDFTDISLLEKDVCLESYLHTNPFLLKDRAQDARYAVASPEYKTYFREQVYANMFTVALANTKLGKSTVIDANFVEWLKNPNSETSLAQRLARLYETIKPNVNGFRLPILFFYVTDPEVARQRIIKRMKQNPAAKDRDWSKVATPAAWAKQIEKEPVTWFDELDQYKDLLGIDMTGEYDDNTAIQQIADFLAKQRTFDEGIFKHETLNATLARLR